MIQCQISKLKVQMKLKFQIEEYLILSNLSFIWHLDFDIWSFYWSFYGKGS
jgi:hypothetical protein